MITRSMPARRSPAIAAAASGRGWSASPKTASARSSSPSTDGGLARRSSSDLACVGGLAEAFGGQARAAGPQLAAGDAGDDPAAGQRLEAVGLGDVQAALAGGGDERLGEWVLGAPLDRCDQRERVVVG